MAPVCCLIVTTAVEHIDDFHGFSDPIDDYGAALKGHRTQPRLKVVTRSAAVRYIANPAAPAENSADKAGGNSMALAGKRYGAIDCL